MIFLSRSFKLKQRSERCFYLFILLVLITAGCSGEKIRVACIGDSITYGAFIENREVNSFPAQLGAMLGESYEVKNFGRSGATLLSKGDLPYRDTEEYKQALAFNPDVVFIKLGTNDAKSQNSLYLADEFVKDYKLLIESYKNLAAAPRIILLVPVPVFTKDTFGIVSSVVTENIIPMVRQIAYETNCEIINLYNLFSESPELFPDKIHPNAEGAQVIAQRLEEFILIDDDPAFDLREDLAAESDKFNFYGFQGFDFIFQGRNAKVVVPKKANKDHLWVWRARFWGHEPQTDIALLERGFHLVYCDVAELFANEEALAAWDAFYRKLTGAGLVKKAVMEGMSRAGIYMYRWAATYPRRVAAVYADAPVLDLKSWPGGKGVGPGDTKSWDSFKEDFKLETEQEALDFKGNPLDLYDEIARAGFPMLHVVGDADKVVPVIENTEPFEEKIKAAGGSITVIHKPGIGHHPHSLPNPQPIINFIMEATK
jgi:lysophospholipase L1-like esterase/pimeloyl-ACP methyl ester carboxylesterase